MFGGERLGEQMFEFAKLLLFVSFGYAFIAFYESPLPGIGVSFSNLITDQAGYFQSVLQARAFDNVYRHLDELSAHFMQPDPWSLLANLIYWTVLFLVAFAKAVSLAVIAFGLIASAVCALLGPIFVPFFIVPKLDWLFWGWLRSFIQYSFVPVVAIAFLMIFEQFVFRYVTTLPPMITQAEYGIYAVQAFAVVATFCMGILQVPSLTQAIFSGSSGQSALANRINVSGILRAVDGDLDVQALADTTARGRGTTRLGDHISIARYRVPDRCRHSELSPACCG